MMDEIHDWKKATTFDTAFWVWRSGRRPFSGRDTRAPDTADDSRGAASPRGDHVKKNKIVQCSFVASSTQALTSKTVYDKTPSNAKQPHEP